ncbi:hypothetical protein KY289_024329 [Solanum tuberosum]|nr:hypothetical protein KY289_024329 [Solanum tuberosum]
MKETIKGITPSWGIMHNYNIASNGRIWVIWDENWYETILFSSTAQLLHFQIKEINKGQQIMLTVVYEYNTIEKRKSLWLELISLAQGISQPRFIAGDSNALLSPQDRLAGAPVTIDEVRYFTESVKDIGVTELQWQGTTILGLTNNMALIEYQAGLIEYLEMMNGWRNGDMLLLSMGSQTYQIIAQCNSHYKQLSTV